MYYRDQLLFSDNCNKNSGSHNKLLAGRYHSLQNKRQIVCLRADMSRGAERTKRGGKQRVTNYKWGRGVEQKWEEED